MSASALIFRARANRLAALKRRNRRIFALVTVTNIFTDLDED